MKTQDIIKSLGMISPSVMPPSLIEEIHERLAEGDELRSIIESLTPGGSEFHNSTINQIEWVKSRLGSVGTVAKERNALRVELETAVSHLNAIVKNIPQGEVEIAREVWGNTNTRIISDSLVAADGWLRNRDAQ